MRDDILFWIFDNFRQDKTPAIYWLRNYERISW